MTSTARIPLDHPGTITVRLAEWYSKRQFGTVLDPGRVMLHHRRVLMTLARLEGGVAKWDALDPTLKALSVMASAVAIGCSWCVDFGYWKFHHEGVDPRKIEDVPCWRESEAYSPLERRVLAYSEGMSATPPEVTDEMVAGLREHLSDKALVELTGMISLENIRSRTNTALGLTSQGFKASCELPGVEAV